MYILQLNVKYSVSIYNQQFNISPSFLMYMSFAMLNWNLGLSLITVLYFLSNLLQIQVFTNVIHLIAFGLVHGL